MDAIECIYVKHEQPYIVTADDELLIHKTLEQLQKERDRALFYRANRQYIVSVKYIRDIEQISGRKIGPYEEPIVVSKDAASAFKAWMEER